VEAEFGGKAIIEVDSIEIFLGSIIPSKITGFLVNSIIGSDFSSSRGGREAELRLVRDGDQFFLLIFGVFGKTLILYIRTYDFIWKSVTWLYLIGRRNCELLHHIYIELISLYGHILSFFRVPIEVFNFIEKKREEVFFFSLNREKKFSLPKKARK
jgi:hypothetical protein